MKQRYLEPAIREFCFADKKMAFISGPRQCGKTTLARLLLDQRECGVYHTWDDIEFRRLWAKTPRRIIPDAKGTPLVVLDEVHKASRWKGTLKGLWDSSDRTTDILVTGSARLNVYKKGGDSLQGRYRHLRLHPFSIGELSGAPSPDQAITEMQTGRRRSEESQQALEAMMMYGAFPEPYLAQDERRARLWRQNRIDSVFREDVRDLSQVAELSKVETMAALLPERIGSPVSFNSLREDLEVSHDSVRRWMAILEELYYLFQIKPFHHRINRTLKKEGKVYLWDFSEVNGPGARFENLVACHLLKSCHYWTDTGYGRFQLWYLRDREKHEIDFLLTRDGLPWLPVDVKLSDTAPSPWWQVFLRQLGCGLGVQIIRTPGIHERYRVAEASVVVSSAAEALGCLV